MPRNQPTEEEGTEDTVNFHVASNCRMYEQKYPKRDDVVIVQVQKVEEMGATVTLLEYNNVGGMILLSELSRRRIRSIKGLIRAGRQEVVMVLRVDEQKGYIDLSKKRVNAQDRQACKDKYTKSKMVHSIMRHAASVTSTPLVDLYEMFGWDLYKRYGHALDAFRAAVRDPEPVFAPYPDLAENVKETLLGNIRRLLTPQPQKLRADIKVTCSNESGINAIKRALTAGRDSDEGITVKLVAPPLYVMLTTNFEVQVGIEKLNNAIEEVKKTITAEGGELVVKAGPRTVTEKDEGVLEQWMDLLEKQNTEVDGDDPTL